MKQTATYKDQRFEIVEDLPEVGFYLYVYDKYNNCIADFLQNSEIIAKEFAFEEFNIPIDSWSVTV